MSAQSIKPIREELFCIALIFLVAMAALYPSMFGDSIPLDTTRALAYPPWADADAPVSAPPSLENDSGDVAVYTAFAFLHSTANRGESLLWNPYEYGGYPFFAAWRSRCLSPFSIPFYYFGLLTAFKLSAFLKILAAGWCAYYAARRLGMQRPFALAVGTAYQLSAGVLLDIAHPIADVTPWIPLLFLFAERLGLGQIRYWPTGAMVCAVMLLGGEPAAVAGIALTLGVYMVVRLAGQGRSTPKRAPILAYCGALLCGAALASVQLIPFLEFLQQTVAKDTPQGVSSGWAGFINVVLPRFQLEGPDPTGSIGLAYFHVGIIQLLLGGLWLSLRDVISLPHRQRIDAMLITAGGILLVVLTLGGLLMKLPLLSTIGLKHLLLADAFLFAMAGAATAEAWLELNPEQCTYTLRRYAAVTAVFLLCAGILIGFAASGLLGPAAGIGWQAASAALAVVVFFAFLIVSLVRPSLHVFGYGLALAMAIDLFAGFHPLMRYTPDANVFAESDVIRELSATEARVTGGESIQDWPLAASGIRQLHGTQDFSLWRNAAFLEAAQTKPMLLRGSGSPVLLLSGDDLQNGFAPLRPEIRLRSVFDEGVAVFDSPSTGRRAWIARETRPVARDEKEDLDPALPPLVGAPIAKQYARGKGGTARIEIPASHTRMRVDVTDAGPGVLVVSDTFYPGWQAVIDGEAAAIFPVQVLFRGVVIDSAAQRVEFSYEPASLTIGAILSLIAAVVALGGLTNILIFRFKLRKNTDA